jgi:hypothetical protein
MVVPDRVGIELAAIGEQGEDMPAAHPPRDPDGRREDETRRTAAKALSSSTNSTPSISPLRRSMTPGMMF